MSAKNQRLLLFAILLLAVLLRVGVARYLGDTVPPKSDELSYASRGRPPGDRPRLRPAVVSLRAGDVPNLGSGAA
jgi:hypothetical protein